MTGRVTGAGRLWFGGDYNPEQWDPTTLDEDLDLMRAAKVTTVTVGVFAWSRLEPSPGVYDLAWLDETLDRLHGAGIRVVLATPTASPPPWFTFAHPEAMPVTAAGTRQWHGSRDTYCAAAPAYRTAAVTIARVLAERYGTHPALAAWHVHNEYGTDCTCDLAAAAFRRWLRRRYHDLDELVAAWNGAFWSQAYSGWDQILPPRATRYLTNPSHLLSWARFWSDELLAAYREQRDVLAAHSPGTPITTNLVASDGWQPVDAWRWGQEVDAVALDCYPQGTGLDAAAEVAFGADRARSWAAGGPWMLLEQGAGVVHHPAQGIIAAKPPGGMLRDSLGYLARGSDTVMFFQWRPGRGGAELHHGGMVPHAGPDSRVYREIVELGEVVERIGEVAGSRVRARVAVAWDADTWWALQGPGLPSTHLPYVESVRELHTALWCAGVTTDFVRPDQDLSRYTAVFVAGQYLCSGTAAQNLQRYVDAGGRLLLGCFSAVVDEENLAHRGGFPGRLTEVVGVRVTEFHPAPPGQRIPLGDAGSGRLWAEDLTVHGADVLARYAAGPLAGQPAVTRHDHGAGRAWYVSTRLDGPALAALVAQVLQDAGVGPEVPGAPPEVEAVRRHAGDGSGRRWLFLTNHGAQARSVPSSGLDLVTGRRVDGAVTLLPGGCAVLREDVAT